MSQPVAQLLLTTVLLTAAVAFILLDTPTLAVTLVGAVLGQGASVSVRAAANGK